MIPQLVSYPDSSDSELEEDSFVSKGGTFAVDPNVWNTVQLLVARVCEHLGEPVSGICPMKLDKYRDVISDSSDTESNTGSYEDSEEEKPKKDVSSSESGDENDVFSRIVESVKRRNLEKEKVFSRNYFSLKKKPAKVKGEVSVEDLPPIENLRITVGPKVKLKPLGVVSATVETLVVIQSNFGVPPLDEDTVLFPADQREALGKVFETFGPVTRPLYSVRFNCAEEIEEHGIIVGSQIFYAPTEVALTKTVFTDQLRKLRGSDASSKDNHEVSVEEQDFSDDEEEKRFKAKQRSRPDDHVQHIPHYSRGEKRGRFRGGRLPRGRGVDGFRGRGEAHFGPSRPYLAWPPSAGSRNNFGRRMGNPRFMQNSGRPARGGPARGNWIASNYDSSVKPVMVDTRYLGI